MKKLSFSFIIFLFSLNALGQIRFVENQIFVNDTLRGTYGFGEDDRLGIAIDVIQFRPYVFSKAERRLIERHVSDVLGNNKAFVNLKPRFYYSKKYQPKDKFSNKQEYLSADGDTTSIEAGELISAAGKRYNGAIAFSFLSSTGGSALVFAGFPIGGAVLTIGGGIVALILYLDGNSKLIRGGQALSR